MTSRFNQYNTVKKFCMRDRVHNTRKSVNTQDKDKIYTARIDLNRIKSDLAASKNNELDNQQSAGITNDVMYRSKNLTSIIKESNQLLWNFRHRTNVLDLDESKFQQNGSYKSCNGTAKVPDLVKRDNFRTYDVLSPTKPISHSRTIKAKHINDDMSEYVPTEETTQKAWGSTRQIRTFPCSFGSKTSSSEKYGELLKCKGEHSKLLSTLIKSEASAKHLRFWHCGSQPDGFGCQRTIDWVNEVFPNFNSHDEECDYLAHRAFGFGRVMACTKYEKHDKFIKDFMKDIARTFSNYK